MRTLPRICALAACVMLGRQTVAAQGDTTRVVNAAPASWHLQVNGYYSSADNGYGIWTGQDARLMYSSKRLSPFVNVGSQKRPGGSQNAFGVGSYVTLAPWMFAIVGVGVAPDNGVVLFPKVRSDAGLFVAVPGVKGVLMSAGFTDLRFTDSRVGAGIWSLGPTIYHGRGIYSGAIRVATDRASGDHSSSWQVGGQWGAQGSYWVGLGLNAGNEAYRVLGLTPFDARFRSEAASAFVSKWVTKNSGVGLRYDFENRVNVYHRHAFALSYFVDF